MSTKRAVVLALLSVVACHGRPATLQAANWTIPPAYSTPTLDLNFEIVDESGNKRVLYNQSHAVLIFEGQYLDPTWTSVLGPAAENERDLKEAFEKRGFKVTVWRNLNGSELRNQLSEIFSQYGNLRNARVFFYYFGHGYTLGSDTDDIEPRTFLVPIDAPNPRTEPEKFLSVALQISQLAEYARQSTTKHMFFALEACRAGSIIATLGGPSPRAPKGYLLSPELQRPVRQFLTAGSTTQDVPARGEFTRVLIEGLAKADTNADGYVTGVELMDYVSLVVPQRVPDQNPQKGSVGRFGGDLIFGPADKPDKVLTQVVLSDQFAECRHPDHGLERWGKTEKWTADSGWRSGGSSPQSFCGGAKLQREAKFADRNVTLVRSSEDHRATYNPFKHDEYHYACELIDQWEPIYKLARSKSCGQI